MATVIRGDDNFDTAFSESIAIIADVKATGVEGGSSVAGWQDRVLNTELSDDQNLVTLSSNQFTLQAGKYFINFDAPAYNSSLHHAQLYNVTDSSVSIEGTGEFTWITDNAHTRTFGSGVVTITGAKTFKVRHRIATAHGSNGLGVSVQSGQGNSVFTRVTIRKIGA